MNHNQNSRRSFIANMAIFSAGAALLPVTKLLPDFGENDLKKQWKSFCTQNNGKVQGKEQLSNPSMISPCKGHFYKPGEVVYFASEEVWAQPTWVYWDKQKSIPHDLIITFYKNDKDKSKFFCINRFELEGLNALGKDNSSLNSLHLLNEAAHAPREIKDKNHFRVATTVDRKRHAKSVASLSKHQIAFQNQLIYNA